MAEIPVGKKYTNTKEYTKEDGSIETRSKDIVPVGETGKKRMLVIAPAGSDENKPVWRVFEDAEPIGVRGMPSWSDCTGPDGELTLPLGIERAKEHIHKNWGEYK